MLPRQMRNVEIKAKVHDVDRICKIAEELSGGPPLVIKQEDIFYRVKNGKMKMRFYSDFTTMLVRYDREEQAGPVMSNYELLYFDVSQFTNAKILDDMMRKSIGTRATVAKERRLYMVGQTRIHIDNVYDLGNFMELEVVMHPNQTLEDGQAIVRDLQAKLGVSEMDLIKCSYVDMLERIAGEAAMRPHFPPNLDMGVSCSGMSSKD